MDTSTLGYRLLELIGISGEFPTDLLLRMGIGENYGEKLITRLKSEHLLKTHYKDKLRGYRLTSVGKKLMLTTNPERFSFYLTGNSDTNQPRSDFPRRLRLHHTARTYVILQNVGVTCFRDEKPPLFQFGMNNRIPSLPFPVFYHSRELKEAGMETVKLNNSRAIGILLTKDRIFALYYTADTVMKWDYKTEIKLKTYLMHHLTRGILSGCYPPGTPIHSLLIGGSMETAVKLMSSTGGYQNRYFSLDTSYDYFHYIPDHAAGETILQLLSFPDMSQALNQLLSSDLEPPLKGLFFEHDASKNGIPILFAYDFDMLRISRFVTGLNLQNKKGTILCFDFQKESLLLFSGDSVTITTIDLKRFEGRFLC